MPFVKKPKKEVKTEVVKETVVESTSPIHSAFYIEKDKGVWTLVIAQIQDDKVISKKLKPADSKALSLEYFKIAFAKLFYFGR